MMASRCQTTNIRCQIFKIKKKVNFKGTKIKIGCRSLSAVNDVCVHSFLAFFFLPNEQYYFKSSKVINNLV